MPLSTEQVKQLLQPINPKRVLRDGKGNAHVAQQDITAHLSRIFGFGNWSKEVMSVELVSEHVNPKNQPPKQPGWDVTYRALVRLTIRDPNGEFVASYEDGSTGTALNQSRGDGHDLAYKSAISLSTKRAAKDLGDQFGLSLYNKGQLTALVGGTLIGGPEPETPEDIQANVEQQVSMGNDEIDTEPEPEPEVPTDPARPAARGKVDPKAEAIAKLKALCAKSQWPLEPVNALYLTTYKVGVTDGSAEDLKAFTALLETGAIKVPA